MSLIEIIRITLVTAISSAALACQTGAELPIEEFNANYVNDGRNFFDVKYGNLSNQSQMYNAVDILTTGASWTGSNATAPVAVFVHGGGWRSGQKSVPRFMKELRGYGITVVAIGYRLSWEAKWPACIDDVESAIKFLKLNADEYRIDPERIIAVGSSAGGHLVNLVGTRNPPSSPASVLGVVDFYGPPWLYGGNLTSELLDCPKYDSASFISHLVRGTPYDNPVCYDKQMDSAPYDQVVSDHPPFLIMQGKLDTATPYEFSIAFRNKLRDAGVDVNMILNENAGHNKEEVLNGTTMGKSNEYWFDKWIIKMFITCGEASSSDALKALVNDPLNKQKTVTTAPSYPNANNVASHFHLLPSVAAVASMMHYMM